MKDETQTTQSNTPEAQPAQAESKAVVPMSDHAPLSYGSKSEVKSLAARIMSLHPSAKQIGDRGALLLAQLGIALGLNPLPGTGHISAWIDKDGRLCVHIGLEGRMSLARRDSSFSVNTRPMRAEEIEEHGLAQGDRGAIAELFRHDLIREMHSLGLPVKPIIGIGIATKGEYIAKGRSLAWRASQRAIKDALRQAYSFSLPNELAGAVKIAESESEVPQGVIEGEFSEAKADTPEPTTETTPEAQPEARPYSPEALRAYIAELSAKHEGKTVNQKQRGLLAGKLNEIFAPADDAESKRKALTRYLFGVESSKELTPSQVIAALDWLNMAQDSGGEWLIDSRAITEAKSVLQAQSAGEAMGLFEQGLTNG